MKNTLIGLFALSTLGLMTVPALADQANVQTSGQVNTQVGDRNNSSQRTNQSNYTNQRGRGENIGSAQDSFQDSYQEGDRNNSSQNTNQRNSARGSRR